MDNQISWPGWETVELIGRGSFGAVYKIQKEIPGGTTDAALKVISIPQNESDIDVMRADGYDDESITSSFRSHLESIVAEYTLMQKMKGSANIVNCEDIRYIQHDDGFGWDIFIKMELLTPLTRALPTDVPEETVIAVAKDMCAALNLCKKYGIIHRDIKPQNIFVSANGDYKLGDFGIAKQVEKTMGGTVTGTLKYMAPEVYNNQPYGTTADIYSLGLVLYWLLNERRLPFLPLPPARLSTNMEEDAKMRRLSGDPLPPPAHGSEKLKKIVLKACAFHPMNRYRSAEDMLKDLNGDAPNPPPPPPNLDVHKRMTVKYADYPAGKHMSIHNGERDVHFTIPMDISNGKTIHLPGKGKFDAVRGIYGDLYITIYIDTAGSDLDVHKELTFEAKDHPAGKHLSVQVDGKDVHFSVPRDIKDGQTIHLSGKGKYDSSADISGDLYITVRIKPATDGKFIYVAIAAIAIVLAIVLFLPKNREPYPPPTTPQTSQNGTQKEPPKATNPPATEHIHDWKEATYTAPKTCTTCGKTEGSKLQIDPVYINELSYSDKYGKVYYHDTKNANYDNNLDWRDLYTPGHIQQAVKDCYGNTFTYGIHVDGDQLGPYYITYNLDSKYSTFSGWCVLPDYQKGTSEAKEYSKYFEIYCDGKKVFTSNNMKNGSSSQYFEIDVTNIDTLTIQYAATKGSNDLAVLCDGLLR